MGILNQYGFPGGQLPVAIEQRVTWYLAEIKNGRMTRMADLLIGAAIGALMTFTFQAILFQGRLSSLETAVRMHLDAHTAGHAGP